MAATEGVDAEAVTAWLETRVEVTPPVRFEQIPGGRSNLTYRLVDADGRRWVLRRPPLHSVLRSAHDVVREHRLMTALAATDVPVPRCVDVETDPGVLGAPFYVMDHVDGEVIRDADDATRLLSPAARGAASEELVSVLATLHDLDVDAIGLGDLARREGYLERQLRRWKQQLQDGRTRPSPLLDEVHARLSAEVPEQHGIALVHGDYRLDNLMLDPQTGAVRAVLDWELATLGDPLADLGLLVVYWGEPGEGGAVLPGTPTVIEGFPDRSELARRYAELSGRDTSELSYYVAFGTWKLACILEGVHGRYVSGAYGDDADPGFAGLGSLVEVLAERAGAATEEAGR